ncbi:MAG TPA: LPXTG cell wall anchor domain-containing protein [Nocardioidaceae bacterium]
MASQLDNGLGTTASPRRRWGLLRVAMAVAIAMLSLPLLASTAYAGEPGVCDTNAGTGKVDSFMQNTEPDGSGDWANGNMNSNKANLVEGDVVPQRVEMSGLQPGENELAFTYDVWVKDKNLIKWAYDYVAAYRMEGGAQITRWYVESPGGPTATVRVTFDVPAGVSTATLYYDLHIASELDHGPGSGAGSISGSPYHGGLVSLNCASSGANANQIMASAIDAGQLTVVKDAAPADGTDFHFSITPGGDASTFALDDDSDATLPDRVTYRVPPGTFTVEELALPDSWQLAGISCSKAPSASTATSRSVAVADDELVTCTFTNRKISRRDLSVTSTADPSYARDYDWSVEKSVVGAASRKIAEGQSAAFDYSVLVTPSQAQDSGFEVSGRISVTNPNDIAFTGVTITDSVPGATCTVYDAGTPVTGTVTIPAGGKDFTYTCVMGAGTTAGTAGVDTVDLAWSAADYYGTTGAATSTQGFDFGAVRPTVSDGSVTVTDSDYDLSGYAGGNVVGATDGPKTFTYSITWPGEPGVCKSYDNTATITETDGDKSSDGARAEVCEGKDLTVEKTVVSDYFRTYGWSLSKAVVGPDRKDVDGNGTATFDYQVTARAGAATDSRWGMSGRIKVSNPNAWPVTLADVKDQVDIGGGASCVVDKSSGLVVAANSDVTFGYTCTFTSQPSYDGTNTATVTWDGTQHVSPSTSASGTAAVVAANWTETSVDKTVTVVDDKTDPANPVVLGTATWAGEGTTKTFTYTGPALAGKRGECVDYTNHAWIQEVTRATASAKVTVCWPVDLGVAKTAAATYDTTYYWDISKQVDRTYAEVGPDGTAAFTYTVVAKPNGSDDSNWKMSGTITVSNPNTFKTVTATLSDVYDGGGTCTPETRTVEVPAATKTRGTITPGVAVVEYSCDFTARPTYTGTNTVTATWDGGRVTGTAPVSFRQDGQTDYEVEVLDDLTRPGEPATVLGTATWDDPLEKRTFTNTLRLGAESGQCVDYTNTAWVDVTSGDVALLPQLLVDGLDPFARQTVTVCEKAPLSLSKDSTATYDTQYFWDISKEADQTEAEVGAGGTAPFTYTVVAKPNGSQDSNWAMSGTITLSNPNTFEPARVTLSDVYDGGGVCTPESTTVDVPEGSTVKVPYTCSFSAKPSYTGTNTVTATWNGETVRATSPVTFRQVGRTDYQVEVRDDLARPGTAPKVLGTATWDDPLEKRTFTNSLDLGAEPGECVDHTNTAWVVVQGADPTAHETVTVCERAPLGVTKDVTAGYDTRYFWDISKQVDRTHAEVGPDGTAAFTYTVVAKPNGSQDSNWAMSGTITVTNPNVYTPATVKLADVYDGGGVCTPESTSVEVPAASRTGSTITPGRADVAYSCTFAEQPAYTGTNTATATWQGQDYTGTAEVRFGQVGRTDYRVDVLDDLTKPNGTAKLLGTAAWDDPVEKRTFTNTLDLDAPAGRCADHTNTAWASLEGDDPSASQTVTVCSEAGLVISKDVRASFDRTYHWKIDKAVEQSGVEISDGGDATFHYTVKATPDGFTDSAYAMGGTITVTNPNTYSGGTITATVTDVPSVGEGAGCAVEGGENVVLEPGQTKKLDYTCSFSSPPDHTGTNTATATWTGPAAQQRSVSTGAVPVTFTATGHANRTVTVTDSMTNPSVLGEATWNREGAPTLFEYSLTQEGTENTCVDYDNTATITETGQSDTETVTVCDQGGLVVTKVADASYDRTYEWDITKVADQDRVDTAKGESQTVDYTVGVTPTGFVDSGWEMTGSVTVSNPNDYKDVTLELTDVPDVGEGVSCSFDDADLVVPAGETRTFGYSCSFEQQPSYDGSNTVVVDWGSGETEATTDVSFEVDQETDKTVTVTDDHVDPAELGTVTWDESGQTTEFGYTLEVEGPVGRCETLTNTATIVETGQDAQADVEVCGSPVPKPRPGPPDEILPEALPDTGAPSSTGLWTMLGGLMLTVGATLLSRRRGQET